MLKQDKSIEKLLRQDKKLTPKQKRFCEEFLVDLNATQAAIRAKYSKKSAYSIGEENLKKPKIRNYMRELLTLRCIRTQVTSDKVIEELRKVAFAKKDIKTRDRLKALDILAKHVGLFDKQIREFPEILKVRELPLTYQETLSEQEELARAIFRLLDPRDRESYRKFLERKQRKMKEEKAKRATETDLEAGGNGEDEDRTYGVYELLAEAGNIEGLKSGVQETIDKLFDRWE